jgi:hypothetical protein
MNTDSHQIARSCVTTARSVLAGGVDFEQFRLAWPIEADADERLWRLMHEVEHYLIDADIRAKDKAYEVAQRECVISLIDDVTRRFNL